MQDSLTVEYCGEQYTLDPPDQFFIGREGDLVVDEDNRFLHRHLIELSYKDGFWWVANIGSRLAVTVSGELGTLHSVIGPGAKLPVVLPNAALLFTAGDTTYEVNVSCPAATFSSAAVQPDYGDSSKTLGAVSLSDSQLLLLVALAEPRLRRVGSGPTVLPTNVSAAERLGWPITTFNRKLDAICDKYDRAGVKGLRGGPGQHATQRRATLVEYVTSAKLVRREHLNLLSAASP